MSAEPAAHAAMSVVPSRLQVTRLGADGDGLSAWDDGSAAFIPLSLPDEIVLADRLLRGHGVLREVVEPSPHRVAPPCAQFGSCGGCALQHADDALYAGFKRGLLVQALRQAGSDLEPAALVRTPLRARRRLDLAARRGPRGILLGLHGRAGAPIDLPDCLVAHPDLVRLFGPLRATLNSFSGLKKDGSVLLNLLESGPDILLSGDGEPDAGDRRRLAEFAALWGIPRISWAYRGGVSETLALMRPPLHHFNGVPVEPPPGAFMQASQQGEDAIRSAVLAGLPEKLSAKSRIIELYAGVGTLTFALAERATVRAYEGDAAAFAALRRAAGGRPVQPFQRDLARQPLQAKELDGAAAIVLDPPHGGAFAQIGPIVASDVSRLVLVSCNPAVLPRDLAPLLAAGFVVEAATPIDQFLFSPRLESVLVLSRAARTRPRRALR